MNIPRPGRRPGRAACRHNSRLTRSLHGLRKAQIGSGARCAVLLVRLPGRAGLGRVGLLLRVPVVVRRRQRRRCGGCGGRGRCGGCCGCGRRAGGCACRIHVGCDALMGTAGAQLNGQRDGYHSRERAGGPSGGEVSYPHKDGEARAPAVRPAAGEPYVRSPRYCAASGGGKVVSAPGRRGPGPRQPGSGLPAGLGPALGWARPWAGRRATGGAH